MTKLTVTVGIPGSGKSDFGKHFARETGAAYVSISDIRLSKTEKTEREVFDEAHQAVRDNLFYGRDCVLDGSHIKAYQREYLLDHIKELLPDTPFNASCVIVATPIGRCFYNNIKKGSKIDNSVIGDLIMGWQTPAYWEGWNEIWVHYENPEWMGYYGVPETFPQSRYDYDLGDRDSFNSLGGHCNSVCNHLQKLLATAEIGQERKDALLAASLIHDSGKPIVRKEDENGKALYYHHANVGAYESFFYDLGDTDPVYVSNLINHHMEPHDWEKKSKAKGFAIRKWGASFVSDLMALNKADKLAKKGNV